MRKWNAPPEPLPSWLDPTAEVTEENDTKPAAWKTLSKRELMPVFVKACFLALRKLGLSPKQSLEVLANAVVETGWGGSFKGWNLGGWKIRKTDTEAAKKKGKVAKWWRAPGNIDAKDPPWCYYRAFDSLEEFFAEWIGRFIPKPGTVTSKRRYKKTGEAFWSDGDWFRELCLAGYKGPVTKKKPEGSIAGHKNIVATSIVLLIQDAVGTKADGAWGPKSTEACKKKEKELGLPETGKPDIKLLEKLYKV